jgi:hypothetical protein
MSDMFQMVKNGRCIVFFVMKQRKKNVKEILRTQGIWCCLFLQFDLYFLKTGFVYIEEC